MKFIIAGSGGCVCTPKPLCQCSVCTEARQRGYPYRRCGCSLYLDDCALLVDTPEDIAVALNNAGIKAVDNILYSHWDPDHTLGMRIMEQLRLEWLDYYDNKVPTSPIHVYALEQVLADVRQIGGKYGSFLDYYAQMGLIDCRIVKDSIAIGDVEITFVPVRQKKPVSVFVFASKGKKLVYAPCDCRPFPAAGVMENADVLIIGNTVVGDVLKNGRIIGPDHPLRKELHTVSDVLEIADRLHIKKTVITHIEEDWGKSFSDYLSLEKSYQNLNFAYDGMVVEL